MMAMILAAGEGRRLAPLTKRQPKPVLPMLNRPHLAHTLSLLRDAGIGPVVINLHHCPERVIEALGDGSRWGISLSYSPEERLLGTAGAVKRAEKQFPGPFLVLYGDNLFDVDLPALLRAHEASGAACTLGLHRAPDPTAAGLVETDAAGRVIRFREKPPRAEVTTDWANAGAFVMGPALLAAVPPETPLDFGRDLFPQWIEEGVRIHAVPLEGLVQDIGTPAGYLAAHAALLSGEGPRLARHWRAGLEERRPGVWCAADAVVEAGAELVAPLLLGERCLVEGGARVGPFTVLGAESRVARGAGVKRAVLWYRSTVDAAAQVDESIVGAGARVGAGAVLTGGTLVGEDTQIAAGARLPAGARLGG